AEGQADRADRDADRREADARVLADVRDESDETIRLVIEPKSRNVDVDVLKDSLSRLSSPK
ncbi:hypothetical protein LCGC14_2214460, partial [marine sediment metagenome]